MNAFDAKTTAYYTTTHPVTQASPSQCGVANASAQTGYFGFLLLFFMVAGLCCGRWFQKCDQQRSIDQRQQHIQGLERIWKMTAHLKP